MPNVKDTPEEDTAKEIPCPNCGAKTLWSTKNPHRPFCSESCRNHDFVSWANEERVMKGNSLYDDLFSADLGNGEEPEDF